MWGFQVVGRDIDLENSVNITNIAHTDFYHSYVLVGNWATKIITYSLMNSEINLEKITVFKNPPANGHVLHQGRINEIETNKEAITSRHQVLNVNLSTTAMPVTTTV